MGERVFTENFIRELKEILLSTSEATTYTPSGELAGRAEEPFLVDWQLHSLEFDPEAGPRRVICKLGSEAKTVTATIDVSDFPRLWKNRSKTRQWNESRYHGLAVLVSVLMEEQILTRPPGELAGDVIRICLPKDRDNP
jgi:hypothetical protein